MPSPEVLRPRHVTPPSAVPRASVLRMPWHPSSSHHIPHLALILHAQQPFAALGAGLLLLLHGHLCILSQRQSYRHPGDCYLLTEMLS